MRGFLMLVICFILAFQGSVSAHAFDVPCSIGHGSMDNAGSQSASLNESVEAAENCCNDAETVARTARLCKTDVPCSSSGACFLPCFNAHTISARSSDPLSVLTVMISRAVPSGVWRPPSFS